nr:MAG TPA: hypothetical protein [Caudoviricetes sp.]
MDGTQPGAVSRGQYVISCFDLYTLVYNKSQRYYQFLNNYHFQMMQGIHK